MWMEIGWALYFQVVGTHKHYMWSSKYFLPQVVGTLKPSIEMLSLPLLCVCSFLLSLLPVHSPSLPFPPLCSLNSLDPSLTLPHRWWGPFHLVYKYPYWLPLTKILGPWWVPTKPFCGYVNEDWVGTVLPGGGTHKHYMWSSKYFPPQVVGTLKPSIEMLLLPLLSVCSPSLPLLPFTPLILPWPCPTGGGGSYFCSLYSPSLPFCSLSLPSDPWTPLILPWPCPTGGGDHTT